LQRITRKVDKKNSGVLFLSAIFFTKLREEGCSDEVNRYFHSKRKDINIFEKKLIFIPINYSLHWSLCIVFNAGRIKESWNYHNDGCVGPNDDAPFLLHLDSLKAHDMCLVRDTICQWLDSEAEKVGAFKDLEKPFMSSIGVHQGLQKVYMPIFRPSGKCFINT